MPRKIPRQEMRRIGKLWSSTYLRLDQIASKMGRKSPSCVRKIIDKQGFLRLCKNCKKNSVPSGRTQFCSSLCRDEYWLMKRTKEYRGKINCPMCGQSGFWYNRIHLPTGRKIGECVQHSRMRYSHEKYLRDKRRGGTHGGSGSKAVKTCYIPKNQWTP